MAVTSSPFRASCASHDGNRRSVIRMSLAVLLTAALFPAACGTNPTGVDAPSRARLVRNRVELVDTEGLEPPVIPHHGVFKPASVFPIDAAATSGPQATAFVLTVATKAPPALRVHVTDVDAGISRELRKIAGPLPPTAPWEVEGLLAANAPLRQTLARDEGIFLTSVSDLEEASAYVRVGVILPEALLARRLRVVVYASDIEGTPVAGAEVNLVREFFYLASAGDSIVWGNGLSRKDKIPALVSAAIERERGVYVIAQNLSQSGAPLTTALDDAPCRGGCWGEAPRNYTSVLTQVRSLVRPEALDLILLSGCINNVGIPTLLDPFTDLDALADKTSRFCGTELREVLLEANRIAPQARLIVLGLYPIVSERSDVLGVQQLRDIFSGDSVVPFEGLVTSLAAVSRIFSDTANAAIAAAVEQVNQSEESTSMVAAAIPSFGDDNALFAPQSWVWNMTAENDAITGSNLGVELFPEDPVAPLRWQACLQDGFSVNLFLCLYASVGHPRPAGARAYADSVVLELRGLGVLPADNARPN